MSAHVYRNIGLAMMSCNIFFCFRWEVIASYITQHLPSSKRTAREVLSQAKNLQKDDSFQRRAANEAAFERVMKTTTAKVAPPKQDDPSQRYMCKSLPASTPCVAN